MPLKKYQLEAVDGKEHCHAPNVFAGPNPPKSRKVFNRSNPCPKCKHPEFFVGKAGDGRPDFLCTSCGHSWTCGHSGGEFLRTAKRVR